MKKEIRTARTIFAAFRAIPPGIRKALFKALAILFYHFSEKNRLIVLHNLTRAFPEKGMAELTRIARGCYRHLAIVAAEFFDILSITKDNISDWMEFEGRDRENYEKAHAKNKGIIFFTGHFGNWEFLPVACAILYQPINIVYREMDDPVIREMGDRVRRHSGTQLIPKGGAARRLLRFLSRNENIGILADQNVSWREGVFVDFFGRPASTTSGLAAIALQTGAPVLPAFSYRMKDGRYRLFVWQEVEIIRTGDYDRDILENTQHFTNIIEEMIRKHPEQWFWLHQRWKTKKSQAVENPGGKGSQA
jgi:KDO2-lipid IV(A) lauroyltransferase